LWLKKGSHNNEFVDEAQFKNQLTEAR
jgi:hypothetical protein